MRTKAWHLPPTWISISLIFLLLHVSTHIHAQTTSATQNLNSNALSTPLRGERQAAEASNEGGQRNAASMGETHLDSLAFILTGLLLGAAGQVGRAVVGLKKEMDAAAAATPPRKCYEWFDPKQLVVSMLLGSVAGLLYAAMMFGVHIDKQFLLGGIAAGYAGSDFIEGFMSRNAPASTAAGSGAASAPAASGGLAASSPNAEKPAASGNHPTPP